MTDQHKLDFEHRQQAEVLANEIVDCADITNYAYELIWLRQQVEAAERWKEAVLDQCMIAHSAFHDGDPRKTLDVLIDWHVKVALDPQASTRRSRDESR